MSVVDLLNACNPSIGRKVNEAGSFQFIAGLDDARDARTHRLTKMIGNAESFEGPVFNVKYVLSPYLV